MYASSVLSSSCALQRLGTHTHRGCLLPTRFVATLCVDECLYSQRRWTASLGGPQGTGTPSDSSSPVPAPPCSAGNGLGQASFGGTRSTSKRKMSLTIRSPSQRTRRSDGTSISANAASAGQPAPVSSFPTLSDTAGESSTQAGATGGPHNLRRDGGPTPGHPHIGGGSVEVLRSLSHFTEPVKRIILIRNGRSEANEDVSTYVSTPDWRIPLVDSGKQECIEAGRKLAELVGDESVYIYYSPYIRSRQSLRYVLQGYDEGRQAEPHRHEWWEDEEGNCDGVAGPQAGQNLHHRDGEGRGPRTSSHSAAQLRAVDAKLDACGPVQEGNDPAAFGNPPPPASVRSVTSDHSESVTAALMKATSPSPASLVSPEAAMAALSDSSQGRHRRSTVPGATAPILPLSKLHDTSLILRSGSNNRIIGVREDVRLRDGDIGRYRNTQELLYHLEERERYGKFFYRFPYGESGADVCDRVTSFLDAFQRERVEFPMNTNVVVITHGLTIRMLIKRWFHLTVDTFHKMHSPPSGSIVTLTRLHHRSCFRLDEACVEGMNLPLSLNEHNGYKYRNKRLLGSMSSGAPYM